MMCAYATNSHPRGAALVIVMLVMAVLLLAGTTFMTISSTESQIALNERVSNQAVHLAEAAIQKAIAQLDQDPTYSGETNASIPCSSPPCGTFTVTVTPASEQPCPATSVAKDIVATATVPVGGGQAVVQLGATVDRIAYPFRWGAFATADYLFLSSLGAVQAVSDSFDSSRGAYAVSNVSRGGDVGGNSGLYLWYTRVQGNARSPWVSSMSATADPSPVSNVPVESFPDVVAPPLPDPLPATLTDLPVNNRFEPGTYHYDVLTIPSSPAVTTSITSQDPVTIYVTGRLIFESGASFRTNGSPVTIYVMAPAPAGNLPLMEIKDNATSNVTIDSALAPVTIYVTVTGFVPTDLWQGYIYDVVNVGDNAVLGGHPATNLMIVTKSSGVNTDQVAFATGSNLQLYGSLYGKNTAAIFGNNARVFGSVIGRRITRGDLYPSPPPPRPPGHREELYGMWYLYPPYFHFDHAMYGKAICLNTSGGRFAVRRGTWREVIP